METISFVQFLIELVLVAYFGFAALYFLVFALASHFYRELPSLPNYHRYQVVVLIPAYREDVVILETAAAAVKHRSSRAELSILVIADSLKPATIDALQTMGVSVLPVWFEKSTKSKSIQKALEFLNQNIDYIVVLDADNIMKSGFVDTIIAKMEQGYDIVQGHRTAKNANTNFAFLDGVSEEVNNSIFREGHQVLGLSASLIGSGFACKHSLFKSLMNNAVAVGGFDKEIELLLLEQKIQIGYSKQAIIFDEKVQHSSAFVNQRRRWLSAQFVYFARNIKNGFIQLLTHGNIDYFDKLIQFFVPPRILALGFSFLLIVLHALQLMVFDNWYIFTLVIIWLMVFITNFIAVLVAIPRDKFSLAMFKAMYAIPAGFFFTIIALFKSKGANKTFIHTAHGINS